MDSQETELALVGDKALTTKEKDGELVGGKALSTGRLKAVDWEAGMSYGELFGELF